MNLILVALLAVSPAAGNLLATFYDTLDQSYDFTSEIDFELAEMTRKNAINVNNPEGISSVAGSPADNIPGKSFQNGECFAGAGNTAAIITGCLRSEGEGLYEFDLKCDKGCTLMINDTPVVDNDGSHAMRSMTGVANLEKYTMYKIKIMWHNRALEPGCGLILKWSYGGSGWNVVPNENLYRPEESACVAALPTSLLGNVLGEYYAVDRVYEYVRDVPMDELPLVGRASYAPLNFPEFISSVSGSPEYDIPGRSFQSSRCWRDGAGEKIAGRFRTCVRPRKSGSHMFFLNCDAGCTMEINGGSVIDNDGDHEMAKDSGAYRLTKNMLYPVTIYWHNYKPGVGGCGLQLSWKEPDSKEEIIPPAYLVPPDECFDDFAPQPFTEGGTEDNGGPAQAQAQAQAPAPAPAPAPDFAGEEEVSSASLCAPAFVLALLAIAASAPHWF